MVSQFNHLDLHDNFILFKKGILTDLDIEVLISLYQPLIGPTAFTILLTLWQTVSENSEPMTHTDLMADLNMDISVFYQNRIKLEAVGLQNTYQKRNTGAVNCRQLIYELIPPVTPAAFFKDDILSVALYEAVGEQRFQELENKFVYPRLSVDADVENITKSFLDVFYVSMDTIPPIVQDAKSNVNQRQTRQLHFTQSELQTFNWRYFKALVARNHISSAEVDNNQLALFNLATFYDINETELARLTTMTMNVANDTIDMAALQRVVLSNYERQVAHHEDVTPATAAVNDISTTLLQQVHFNNDEIDFIKHNLNLFPRKFLEKYRELHSNFVSKSDALTLSSLVQRHVLSDALVNLLSAYVLQDHNNLTTNVVDTIANEWYQRKISEPNQALQQILKYQQKAQTKPRTYRNNYQRRKVRVEKKPQWMQPGYQPPEISDEELAALEKKNQELMKKLGLQKDESNGKHE